MKPNSYKIPVVPTSHCDITKITTNNTSISVTHLSKHFGHAIAVDNVCFEVKRGDTCALLGGNGAGKSTIIAILLGLLTPTSGSVRVLGCDMHSQRYGALPRLNFSSPYVDLPKRLTVAQNLKVYAKLYGVRRSKEHLRRLATELQLEPLLSRTYGTLSAGQKTRVSLAKALVNTPDLLLLDEPTASLDPDTADRMRAYLETYRHATGATILIASHNMSEVERMCDDVLMIKNGTIVSRGSPKDLVDHYGRQTLEEVFLDVARR